MSLSSFETKLPDRSLQIGLNHELEIVIVPVPLSKHGEVSVKVKAVGICV